MKATHTPGPYLFGPTSLAVMTERGHLLADLSARQDDEAHIVADGRLFAAAPELLAMLRHLCAAIDMSDSAHPNFTDSCADVVDFLHVEVHTARDLLARFD